MTDKAKRIILIAAGVLLCAVLVVGIVSRLAVVPMPIDPAIPDDTPNTKDPVVNISDPEVKVDSKTDGEQHDLGRDADSSGTEQTIQGAPTKPGCTGASRQDGEGPCGGRCAGSGPQQGNAAHLQAGAD